MPKLSKKISYLDEVQGKIAQGLEAAYRVAKNSYGPKAHNAMIEQPFGEPLLSRDGVTNLRKVYLKDPIANMAVKIAKQASEKNNKKVGDGTTAVVILAYHLFTEARKLVAAGYNQMEVAKRLDDLTPSVLAQIDKTTKPVTPELLPYIASVSAGDEAVGAMIADVLSEIGPDGGITVENFEGIGIHNELVDGCYFQKGFTNINLINDISNLESKHENVPILITEKPLRTATDIAPILDKIVGSGIRELVIIGEVGDEALGVLILNRVKGNIMTAVADVPVFAGSRSLLMEDISVLTGGQVLLPGVNPTDFNPDWLGAAAKVVMNEYSTAIIGADGAAEDVEKRIKELRAQLKDADSQNMIDALKSRLTVLTGKVAIIRVGGATPVEQGEVKLRVEDAIAAVQAAIKQGIVPGGGVVLARLETDFKDAFEQPFKQLMDNAGLNADRYLAKLETAGLWEGFDLNNMTDEPIDMLKAGVIDPSLVLKEVVTNAVSIASRLITTGTSITYIDRTEVHD